MSPLILLKHTKINFVEPDYKKYPQFSSIKNLNRIRKKSVYIFRIYMLNISEYIYINIRKYLIFLCSFLNPKYLSSCHFEQKWRMKLANETVQDLGKSLTYTGEKWLLKNPGFSRRYGDLFARNRIFIFYPCWV